jgi:LPXTG-motif cell wall-anchored protein
MSAVAIVGAAVLAVAAAPATAQPPAAIGVSFPDVVIAPWPNTATTDVRLDVAAGARDLTVTIDLSGLAGVAAVQPPLTGCTTVADTITCPVPDERRQGFPLTIATASLSVPVGRTGTLTISASASNVPGGSHTATVTVRRAIVDAAAIGATVTGAVGDTVKITFGIKSNGPDSLLKPTGTPFNEVGFVDVTMPPGVTVVGGLLPFIACDRKPGSTNEFSCKVHMTLPAGDTQMFELDVRLDRAVRNATGKVVVRVDATDPNPANNTAAIIINPGPGLPAPGLPVTGARTATLAATGALLVVLGTIGFALFRRRRHRFVVED